MATKYLARLLLLSIFLLAFSALALCDKREGPEERFLQCQQQCQRQHQHDPSRLSQCQRRCQEQYEEERKQHGGGRGDHVLGQEGPEERFLQCQQQCQRQHQHDPSRLSQCQRRCQDQYEEERRQHGGGRGDHVLGQGSPEERLQQCQQQCQRQHQEDPSRLSQCRRRCQDQYEEERRQHGGGRGDNVLGQGSPEERLQQCQQQCQRQHQEDPSRLSQCRRRCQDQYEEERRQHGGGRGDNVLGQGSPEERLQQCQQQCQRQHQEDPSRLSQCRRRCQEEYEEERRRGQKQEGGRGSESDEDLRERLQQCRQQCSREIKDPREVSQCQQRCKEQYEQEQGGRGSGDGEEEEEAGEGQQQRESPYFFDQQSFQDRIKTQYGSLRVLEKFTRQNSELFRAIEDYRLAILEANPRAFVLPNYLDADSILFVSAGHAAVGLQWGENNRASYNVRKGDIISARAGTMVYIANTDHNEKLYIVKLLRFSTAPGAVREYFGVGGENPESLLRSFSSELLQAAYNAPKESVETIWQKQKKGAIVQASQEQVRAISRRASEARLGPFSESSKPFNLFDKRPTHSSDHGQLFEANPEDYQGLQDLDVQVSFANITSGSMMAPFYLTRSTMLLTVLDGEAEVQMACPDVSGESEGRSGSEQEETTQPQQGQSRRVRYQKVRARVSRGTTLLAPVGCPVAIVASRRQNLQALFFEINAKNNQRVYLAGRNSILKKLEKDVKELSFDMPARHVDEFFNRQQHSVFTRGPEQRQEKSITFGSILGFADF